MTPTEKYSEEKDELKSSRKNRILQAAFNLFSEKGIDTIAMTDIAKNAEIGVASLYRYYTTKDEIAIQTAIWAWEQQKLNILPYLNSKDFQEQSGIAQLKIIFNLFIVLYENQSQFLRFIYFFDSFAVRTAIDKKRLVDYEKMIETVQEIVAKSISKGFEDNSINSKFRNSNDYLYFTLMHTLFSTVQKLSLSEGMLQMDSVATVKKQLELLSDLLIESLKA